MPLGRALVKCETCRVARGEALRWSRDALVALNVLPRIVVLRAEGVAAPTARHMSHATFRPSLSITRAEYEAESNLVRTAGVGAALDAGGDAAVGRARTPMAAALEFFPALAPLGHVAV